MDGQPLRILLVEDDEDDFILTRGLLAEIRPNAYALQWAATGEMALGLLDENTFDLLLLDYRIGEADGLELLRQMREVGSKAPVIMLTGQGDRQVDLAAMRAGAADYLVKDSINAQLLERAIRYTLERTALLNRLSELVIQDELTGLYNRRMVQTLLQENIQVHRRKGTPFSLVMLDIDDFKQVNDTHGHQIGDELLRGFSKRLVENVRTVDRVARYGGDEFCVLLPETAGQEAVQVTERICRKIAERPFSLASSNGSSFQTLITASAGIAQLPGDAGSKEGLIKAADRALYAAKQRGCNRTLLHQELLGGAEAER